MCLTCGEPPAATSYMSNAITQGRGRAQERGLSRRAPSHHRSHVMASRAPHHAREPEAAKAMIVRYSPCAQRITVGGDKAFDTADFVADMRAFDVTPSVAQNTTGRHSATL
jgi:hypothetical protein